MSKVKSGDAYYQTLFGTDKNLTEQLVCYAMVEEYAKAGLAERWAFARKFAEYLGAAGINLGDSRNNINRLLIVSGATDGAAIAKDEKKALYTLVHLLCDSSYARTLTGANAFNGTVWFNKETTDWTLAHAFAVLLLDEKNESDILKAFDTAVKAKDKAEYKCEEFVKPFAPVEKKASKAKKSVEKSAKAEKAEKPAKAKKCKK